MKFENRMGRVDERATGGYDATLRRMRMKPSKFLVKGKFALARGK
jgi:hypothetical protein